MTLILEAFDGATPTLTLVELSERTGLPRSTVHRILDQLVRLRWLAHAPGGYRLGLRTLELGGLAADHNEIRDAVSPLLHDVCQQTGMVGHLGVLDGREVLYLDKIGGLRRIAGEPVAIAARLRARVRDRVGLPISVGIARTKFLAKVASAVAKPDGLRLVPPDGELTFLHPLPVERLWGVGDVTARTLHEHGITRVGQLAELGEGPLRAILGPAAARHLYALSWARDPRRVETGRRRRSIGAQRALGRKHRPPEEIEAYLHGLTDRLGRRLRTADRVCRTVVLRLRFDDFTRATRSHTMAEATDHTETILLAARTLLTGAMPLIQERGLTLIGLALTNLDDADSVQLTLPFEARAAGSLDATLDDLRKRFGSAAVTRAALLHRGEGLSVPLLPD
ncbi:helix-turn-helix domain-containing protein [Nocardia beijingensis]|uniref:DinB/UmuC family translesion DNA polymerase n=1 Tax=Nocardia beijingensis TaxID=95162 RepID=UPI00344D577D